MSIGTYETLLILAGICFFGAGVCIIGAALDSRHFHKRRKMAEYTDHDDSIGSTMKDEYNQTVDRR